MHGQSTSKQRMIGARSVGSGRPQRYRFRPARSAAGRVGTSGTCGRAVPARGRLAGEEWSGGASGPAPRVRRPRRSVRVLRLRRRQLVSESVPRTCRSECVHRPEWLPVGGVARPGPARRPGWCTARAGSVPAVGPGTVRARRRGRLGRVRIGGEPGHSGSEVERPAGPGSARRRARAQWSHGGAADWPELGPAAGPGTVVTRRSSRRAGGPPCSSDIHGPVRPRASSRPSRAAAARPLAGGE